MNRRFGLEVFGPNGEVVFTSEKKTPMVHAYGVVTVNGTGDVKTIVFDPTDEQPELFVGNAGIWLPVFTGAPNIRLYCPFGGLLEKDAEGKYYSFKIFASVFGLLPPGSQFAGGWTDFPWSVPWVVFV